MVHPLECLSHTKDKEVCGMNICLWSSSNFEQSYASYHIIKEIILAMLNSGHEVYLLQTQLDDGAMPPELQDQKNLHVVNVPWKLPAKTSFVKRYLNSINF